MFYKLKFLFKGITGVLTGVAIGTFFSAQIKGFLVGLPVIGEFVQKFMPEE